MDVRIPKITQIRKSKWDGMESGFTLGKIKTLTKHYRGVGWIVGGKILVPQRRPHPNSANLWICYVTRKKDFADVIKLRPWDGEFVLNFLSEWVQTKVFKSRRGGQEKRSNATWEGLHLPLLALMEKGAINQELVAASRSWRRQISRFSQVYRKEQNPGNTLILAQWDPC